MKQKEQTNTYTWLTIDDLSIVEDWEILKTLEPPNLLARGMFCSCSRIRTERRETSIFVVSNVLNGKNKHGKHGRANRSRDSVTS